MKFEEIRYKILWIIGTVISFVLVYSGIVRVYLACRKKLFKKYRCIVLTYHRIRDDDLDPDISVSRNLFSKQMRYLKDKSRVVSLDEAVKSLDANHQLNNDIVAITLDDGYQDNYDNAFPILKQLDIPSIIFVITGLIGNHQDFLSIEAMRAMKQRCISFGAHTVSHPVLSMISEGDAEREIYDSKASLELMLGTDVRFFAYPKGKQHHFNQSTIQLVKGAGYEYAFTTVNGCLHSGLDNHTLPRIGIRNAPMFVFKARVSGIYESSPILWLRNLLKAT